MPPLGNFNPSKLNTAHYTHMLPPQKCFLTCFCPTLGIFLNDPLIVYSNGHFSLLLKTHPLKLFVCVTENDYQLLVSDIPYSHTQLLGRHPLNVEYFNSSFWLQHCYDKTGNSRCSMLWSVHSIKTFSCWSRGNNASCINHPRFIWIARSVLEIHVFEVRAFENAQSGPFSQIHSQILVKLKSTMPSSHRSSPIHTPLPDLPADIYNYTTLHHL